MTLQSDSVALDDSSLEDISGGRRRRRRRRALSAATSPDSSGNCNRRIVGTWRVESTPATYIPGTWTPTC